MSEIINFLLHDNHNHSGKTFWNMLYQPFKEFDEQHDQIQWLFPLFEKSKHQPNEPVLTDEDLIILKRNSFGETKLWEASNYMFSFYTNYWNGWSLAYDHNHLRITRIIKCIALFRGFNEAKIFTDEMLKLNEKHGSHVNQESINFWYEALKYKG